MADGVTVRNRMLAVIMTILVIAGLRASYSVTMPVTVAALIVAAVWPIKPWLDRFLPSVLSYAGTVLLLLFIFAAFTIAVYFSAAQAVAVFAEREERLTQLFSAVSDWVSQWGLSGVGGDQAFASLSGFAKGILTNGYTTLVYVGFIAILVILGLPEVPPYQTTLNRELEREDRREVRQVVHEIARKIRSYLGVMVVTSFLTGIGSYLIAMALGLDLALVWGVLNFLLNFVPVVGNIVGIIPPTIYAFIQFDGWTMPVVVFIALSILQIVISNFVYPLLQGHSLSLSPVVVIVALAFWSWVWGIAGALVAVPLTAAMAIVFDHFRSTAWIATLLSGRR